VSTGIARGKVQVHTDILVSTTEKPGSFDSSRSILRRIHDKVSMCLPQQISSY
jgi:hypothetical protein